MEFEQLPTSLNQIMLPQVEPIGQLAPYLSGLNIVDAVQSFNQLADLVMLTNEDQPMLTTQPAATTTTCARASDWSECSSPWNSSTTTDSSSASGSQWLSSSGASSPAPSDRSQCSWSRSSTSSASTSSLSTRSSSSSSSTRSSRPRAGDRLKKNASAAEKYRRKQKGRECGLAEQMELEQERNEKLRRDIEAKLALYREFVGLLALNTNNTDVELASLGSKSLNAVLTSGVGNQDEELQKRLAQFEQILASSSSSSSSSSSCSSPESAPAPAAVETEDTYGGLAYDFFTDTFVDS